MSIDFQPDEEVAAATPSKIDFQPEVSPGQLLAQTRSTFGDVLKQAGQGILHKVTHPFEVLHDVVQGVNDAAVWADKKIGLLPESFPPTPLQPLMSPESGTQMAKDAYEDVRQATPLKYVAPNSNIGPVGEGVARFAGGALSATTDPSMAPAMLAPGGAQFFKVAMPMQVPETAQQTLQAIKSNDVPGAVEGGLNTLLSVVPAVHPVYEGFKGEYAPRTPTPFQPILDEVTKNQRPLENFIKESQPSVPEQPVVASPAHTPVDFVPEEAAPVVPATPPPELTPEQHTDLRHALAGLQQGFNYAKELGYAPDEQSFLQSRGQIWMDALKTGDYPNAMLEVEKLKKTLRKPAGTEVAPESTAMPMPGGGNVEQRSPALTAGEMEMEQKRLNDLQIEEEPGLAGPRMVEDEFKGKSMEGTQILNRLRNRLSPGEWKGYEDKGIRERFEGKIVEPKEVSKWMQENGPRVEVRKLEAKGDVNANEQELARLTHEWLERLPSDLQDTWANSLRHDNDQAQIRELIKGGFEDENLQKATDLIRLEREVMDNPPKANESATARFTMVNPKPLDKMPGAVDLLVRVPVKEDVIPREEQSHRERSAKYRNEREGIKYQSSHYPTEGKNLLAHVRGYMETLPDGKKVFHVFEVQSDWGQAVREGVERLKKQIEVEKDMRDREQDPQVKANRQRNIDAMEVQLESKDSLPQYGNERTKSDTLLPHYERLALKAAIEHAKEQGADAVALSDAETAMMTEGHDKLPPQEGEPGKIIGPSKEEHIDQAQGMRLHYDRTLPKIAEELTGDKGKSVDFGEHQNAFEKKYISDATGERKVPRLDLIFRNPDGTPKTSITARMYSLDKVRPEDFTLFDKNRPKPTIEKEPMTESPIGKVEFAKASEVEQKDLEKLGIKEGSTAHSALEELAKAPQEFGTENAKLAQFLVDNFEHVLRTVELKADAGRSENNRANYDPITHSIQLALGNDGNSTPFKLLEESAHAATWWQFEQARTPTQLKAKENITRLLEQATLSASEEVQAKIGTAESGLAYRLKSEQEFIAGLFTDPELKQHLQSFTVKQGELVKMSGWDAAKNYVKELLGIKPNTAYARALEQLVEVGAERDLTSIDRARADYELDPVSAPSHVPTLSTIHDITFGNKMDKFLNKRRGYTFPAHVALNEHLANLLVRTASAGVYGPEAAKSIATDVLGPRYWRTDNKLLGAVIVEDQLREAKRNYQAQANAEPDPVKKAELQELADNVVTVVQNNRMGPLTKAQTESGIKSEQHYKRLIANPENQEILQRFKTMVMPIAEQAHKELGGTLLKPGADTGVFANLKAILGDEGEATFSSRKGNLSNPLVKGSKFSKQRKGTAESYDYSIRNMVDRMIRANYEEYSKQQYYKAVETEGRGFIQKQGDPRPITTINGKPLRMLEIKRRGGAPGQTVIDRLWMVDELYDEARHAFNTEHSYNRGVLGFIADAATTLQVTGTVDIASHLVNMIGTLSGMQGSKAGLLFDGLKKSVPPVGFMDAAMRIGYNWVKAVHDAPDTQRAIAEYSKIGAGREQPIHKADLISRGLQKVGVSENIANAIDLPQHMGKLSGMVLKQMDRAGRLAALEMYKEMVRQGRAEDSELAKREFVNNMGQYQSKMMPHFPQLFRELGLSNFVVAGTTMNRNAIRRLLISPLVRSASPEAWTKMRVVEMLSLAGAIYALPMLLNTYFTGNPAGRKGTPLGAIDYGKPANPDGSHDYFDWLQLMLLRRAVRITGAQSVYRGMEEKEKGSKTLKNVVSDIAQGYLHPYMGPAPRLAYTAATGKDTSGYLLSRNPESMAENVTAAMKNANPNIAAWIKGKQKGQGKLESTAKSLGTSLGFKTSPVPTYQDRLDNETQKQFPGQQFDKLMVGQRRQVVKAVENAATGNDNELARRAAGMRAYWADYEKQDALKEGLPKPQQDWLDKNKLTLPAFQAEVTQAKVKIKATESEEQFMAEKVQQHYQERIESLMQQPQFEDMTQKEKQRRLNNLLDLARKRARIELRQKMNSAGR